MCVTQTYPMQHGTLFPKEHQVRWPLLWRQIGARGLQPVRAAAASLPAKQTLPLRELQPLLHPLNQLLPLPLLPLLRLPLLLPPHLSDDAATDYSPCRLQMASNGLRL